jgi:hypothetical protein
MPVASPSYAPQPQASVYPASQPPAHAPAYPPSQPPAHAAPPYVAAPGQEVRIRVSVKLSVRDPNLIVARALGDGESAPAGTREAVLVLVEPGPDAGPPANGGGE